MLQLDKSIKLLWKKKGKGIFEEKLYKYSPLQLMKVKEGAGNKRKTQHLMLYTLK